MNKDRDIYDFIETVMNDLSNDKATTADVVDIGIRLIVSGYKQLVYDNPACDSKVLLEGIIQQLTREMKGKTNMGTLPN